MKIGKKNYHEDKMCVLLYKMVTPEYQYITYNQL